jgi:hypothetical protein
MFLFKFGGEGGKDFFSFFPSSQCVPTMFISNFQWVPNMFPKFPHFYPICFAKCCPPFTYIGGPKGENVLFQNRTFYFGEPIQC